MDGPSPLFAQVRDALRAEILRGDVASGERLPSESALVERFGVSRITVRQAIAELQTLGLVQTVNGKGTYVRRPDHAQAHGPLVGVLEAMRKRGHRARGKLLSHKVVAAQAIVANELELPVGSPVGAVTVLRFRDDQPFVVGTTWSRSELAERLAREDLSELDIMAALEDRLGVRIARTRVVVSAALADAKLARRLDYAPGAAVLRIRTTSLDHDQRPIVYSETDCRADMMDYRVTLRR